MEYIEAETGFISRPFTGDVDVGERIGLNQLDLLRSLKALKQVVCKWMG